MQISRRTKFSLAQLLGVIERPDVYVVFEKYGLNPQAVSSVAGISSEIQGAHESVLSDLVVEVVQSNKTLRNQTSPRYKFDEKYSIFQKSLLLDGYGIEGNQISALDPNFAGHEPVEDELLKEIDNSNLSNKGSISQAVKASAEDFIKAQPDYNGSLTNIRIALETIVREIAILNGFVNTRGGGNTWGPSLAHLRMCGFIDTKEEQALAAVFTFISNGAHIPLGFSHEEFVRLGRNMCSSMCYFVMKKFNA
ncbi:hypothetical protein CGG78_24015 [Vibrio parahaemolyticus]|uniref:hypothetical protein n=2 Tax=Vibrio parahaemolyticus TaxID=670 RepID=UPI001122B05A|nr:hypothetical protein [Vibrio parahaemolyticus]MBE3816857.1 hypothetical protein [Vibrio parahaemolyticus]MBE3884740.1 hypothetical protein [Vibrio parahaemolyticus]MBE4178368.1 hypothetical protein [Vibrio parahaemolyticus]MBE4236580.1 hypothetical protein [Vibrio parahaemolyticus]MBE4263513.1 hypothetical protein [Vibrio parahaemolyticus]